VWEGWKHRGNYGEDQAVIKFAQAAGIEERLSKICEKKGLVEKSFVYCFSAVAGHRRAISITPLRCATTRLPV
jgi:hypothetical protein